MTATLTAAVTSTVTVKGGWTYTVTLSNGTTVKRRSTRAMAAIAFDPETSGKGCCTNTSADARKLMARVPASYVVVDLGYSRVLKQPGTDLRPVREAATTRTTRTEGQQRAWEKFQKAPARIAKQFRKTAEYFNPEATPVMVVDAQHYAHLARMQAVEVQRAELIEALTTEALLELFNAGRRTGGDLESWAERQIRG